MKKSEYYRCLVDSGLFPAHAGVILSGPVWVIAASAVPRTRGGDPGNKIDNRVQEYCSPHTRG